MGGKGQRLLTLGQAAKSHSWTVDHLLAASGETVPKFPGSLAEEACLRIGRKCALRNFAQFCVRGGEKLGLCSRGPATAAFTIT